MNRNVRKALDIALDAEHPRRFHHELARTGYSDGGLPSIADMAHDVPYLPKGDTSSPLSIAKVQPYTAAGIEPPASSLAPTTTKIGHPKKLSIKAPKAGKVRLRKPKAMKPRKLRFDKGGPAIEDALNLASKTMSNMAKETQDMDMPMRGESMSQGSTSTIVKEKVPGKRAHMIYERHEQTPPEHHMFESDLHPDVVDALRLARATGGRDRWDVNKIDEWRLERGKKGHKKNYDPWADPENMYTHPTEEHHDPEDPMYHVYPEDYERGDLGRGRYALENGGRAHLAIGGNPLVGATPNLQNNSILDPTVVGAGINPAVPAIGGITPSVLGAAANPALNTVANPATSTAAIPAVQPLAPSPTAMAATSNTAPAATAAGTSLPIMAQNTSYFNPNQAYVDSLYQNIMGRAPDTSGSQYWADQLTSGQMGYGDILQNFAQSPEFQSLYNTNPSQAVSALYQTALGRAPDAAGVNYWTQQAQQGMPLSTLAQNFLTSDEGLANEDRNIAQSNAQGYVGTLYQNILGRNPDANGLQYWSDKLMSGQVDSNDLLYNFAQSPEFQNLYSTNPSQAVSALYQTALGRAPDAAGVNYWTQQAQQGMPLSTMLQNFSNSEEGQNVQDINQMYQEYTGQMATPDQVKQAMSLLGTNPDMADFIAKTFPSNDTPDNLTQEAANTKNNAVVSDALKPFGSGAAKGIVTYANRMGRYNPNTSLISRTNWANAETLKNSLSKLGLPDQAVYSIIGNFAVESNGLRPQQVEIVSGKKLRNPKAEKFRQERANLSKVLNSDDWQNVDLSQLANHKLGIGLGQWTNTRAVDLINFAKQQGKDWKDMGVQSDFLANELASKFQGLVNYYKNNPNAGKEGVAAFERIWENPRADAGRSSAADRYNMAVAASQYFGSPDTFGNFGISPLVVAAKQNPTLQTASLPGGTLAGPANADTALAQTLAQSGAGGNVAGSGMSNPSGGPIGGPTFDPNAINGSTAGFPTWTPQSTGSLPTVNQMPVNYVQIGTFDPYTSQQTSMGWDPMTGIGLHSPLYAGPGQYFNPGLATGYVPPTATNFSGSLAFGPGFRDGGSVGTRSRVQRALEMLRPMDDDIEAALRLARGRRA